MKKRESSEKAVYILIIGLFLILQIFSWCFYFRGTAADTDQTSRTETSPEETILPSESEEKPVNRVISLEECPDGIELRFETISDVPTYKIYRSTDHGENYILIGKSKTGIYKDAGALLAGVSYSYKITAKSEYSSSSLQSVSDELVRSEYAFAEYTGVDYTQLTENPYRVSTLDFCKKMSTVLWEAPFDFITWYHSEKEYCVTVAEDGTEARNYVAGKIYKGIPYSLFNMITGLEAWSQLFGRNMTPESMEGLYEDREKPVLIYGIDCSHLLYQAIKTSGIRCVGYQCESTQQLKNSTFYTKIDWEEMLPGDILLNRGHVRIFAGLTEHGHYACFESIAGLNSVSGCRYKEYTYDELTKGMNPFTPYRFLAFAPFD